MKQLHSVSVLVCHRFPLNGLFLLDHVDASSLGFAMAYLPSSVLAGLYFNKHRSLASGIVTSGSGLGNIVFPFIGHTLISFYGWKGSMFILAGLMLQCVAFAALLFPLEVKVMKDERLKVLDQQEELQLDKVNSINGPVSMETVEQNDVEKSDKTDGGLNENEKMLPTSIENGTKATKVSVDETENQSLKHCYVLCNFSFLVFFLNNIVWNMGAAIAWVLGPEYYVNMGLSKEDAAIIITFEGIGCFIGCIVGGGLGNIQRLSRLYMYIMWNIIIGVFTLVVPITIFQTVEALSFIMFVHGLGFGGILGLLVIFTVDLLGEKSLGDGFGYLMLSNGVGAIIGPPIGGVLKDSLGTYDVSFYLSGALIVVAGLAMFIIPVRNSFNDPKKVTEMGIEVMPSNSKHE